MDDIQPLLDQIPFDHLADELGTDPRTAEALSAQLIPALITGMSANADDPAGERSLAVALDQHSGSDLLAGGIDLDLVDPAEGSAIVHNVFGNNTDAVVQTLGQQIAGGDSSLIKKLLPILAPIVLAYLGKKLSQGRHGDLLGPILEGLGGAAGSQRSGRQTGQPSGGSLQEILLDMLGMGQRARNQEPTQEAEPRRRADAETSSQQMPPFPVPQQPATPEGGARVDASPFDAPAAPQPRHGLPVDGPEAPAPDQIPVDGPVPAGSDTAAVPQRQAPGGDVLMDVLGGLLGAGRRG